MLIRLIFILRRRWPIVVVIPLLSMVAALAFTPREAGVAPEDYTSTAVIAVEPSVGGVSVQQAMLEAQQGEIAATVAKEVGGGVTASEAGQRLNAQFDSESYVIRLGVSGDTKEEAKEFADAFADAFVLRANAGPNQQREAEIMSATEARDKARDALRDFLVTNADALGLPTPPPVLVSQRDALQRDVDTAESTLARIKQEQPTDSPELYRLINITTPSKAVTDQFQIPASTTLRLSLSLILGCMGAALLVALVEKLNPCIDDPATATDIVGAPILAMVPVMSRRQGRRKALLRPDPEDFTGPFAESFRSARAHLEFRASAEQRTEPPRIMVTSATPADGKSTTAAFLALAFAEAGHRPVVVGADLRRPAVHTLFEVPRIPGLTSRAVLGDGAAPFHEIIRQDEKTGVAILPAGPHVERVTDVLKDLVAVTEAGQRAGRTVIVDTAPVMVANDVVDFLMAVDWVVIVIRVGRSTERSVRQMMQSLALTGAQVAGVIMVGSMESSDAKRYYYSYYQTDEPASPVAAPPAVQQPAT